MSFGQCRLMIILVHCDAQVLGVFSSLQKSGKQAKAQGQFAFSGSLARVLMPVATGFLEQYVEYSSSFSMVLVLMSVSLVGVGLLYQEIEFFSSSDSASHSIFERHTVSVVNGVMVVLSTAQWQVLLQ